MTFERVAPSLRRNTASASPPSACSAQVEAGRRQYNNIGFSGKHTLSIPKLHSAIERTGDSGGCREETGACWARKGLLEVGVNGTCLEGVDIWSCGGGTEKSRGGDNDSVGEVHFEK